jgi:hypothetical protein
MNIKGREGETCAEAIQRVIQHGEVLRYSELFTRTRKRGKWSERVRELQCCDARRYALVVDHDGKG